jgi:RND superfamily putative drug exporter
MTVLSALAALGLGGWASVHVFGFPALDNTAPLFDFLFLVALGVDYTRAGIVRAVSATGTVIISAGIVLAAVFCVLGVLPLIVIIPALFTLIGPRIWWPALHAER